MTTGRLNRGRIRIHAGVLIAASLSASLHAGEVPGDTCVNGETCYLVTMIGPIDTGPNDSGSSGWSGSSSETNPGLVFLRRQNFADPNQIRLSFLTIFNTDCFSIPIDDSRAGTFVVRDETGNFPTRFFFTGKGTDGSDIRYRLNLYLAKSNGFLPPTSDSPLSTLYYDSWSIVKDTGPGRKKVVCEGSGSFNPALTITVEVLEFGSCADGDDNDYDTSVDCADADCASSCLEPEPGCTPQSGDCKLDGDCCSEKCRKGRCKGGADGGGGSLDLEFVRGDVDLDGEILVSDVIFSLRHLFGLGAGSSCPDASDANDDGGVNIADPIYTLMFLFAGGPALPPPYPEPGRDPTTDLLGCE